MGATIVDITGKTGVSKTEYGWTARIFDKGDIIHLGTFTSFEEACTAQEEAELKYYGFTKE